MESKILNGQEECLPDDISYDLNGDRTNENDDDSETGDFFYSDYGVSDHV